jgi:hypothetical protein
MLLKFGAGVIHITGALEYSAGERRGRRFGILLQVGVEEHPTEVILDTGAPYFMCTPQLATIIDIHTKRRLFTETILFRGKWLEGSVYSLKLAIAPDDGMGSGIELKVSGFVPSDPEGLEEVLPYPSLGWIGCLESTPFAVDPGRRTFYFC